MNKFKDSSSAWETVLKDEAAIDVAQEQFVSKIDKLSNKSLWLLS